MQILFNILAIIGGISVISLVALGVALVAHARNATPDEHPELQDDFSTAMARWRDTQERMGK